MSCVEGWYVYAEATGYFLGHFGELLGPNMMPSQTCQIYYCYSMNGKSMGTLNLYQRFSGDPKPDQTQKKIWSLSGDQGNKWRCRFQAIPSNRQFSIVFEAVRGNGYQSDIALDDIRFVKCASLGPTPGPTTSPKPSLMDEDFEDCTSCWENEKNGHDQMDWIIGRGETASLNTGPSYDHTKKTIYGRYLYIDASSVGHIQGWAHADLESRLMVVQRRCYMTFWYHMYGSGVGSLQVVAYVFKDPKNLIGKSQKAFCVYLCCKTFRWLIQNTFFQCVCIANSVINLPLVVVKYIGSLATLTNNSATASLCSFHTTLPC